MLVLSRKIGQSVLIGTDISVRVLRVRGRVVGLGISAPKDVPIRRGELTGDAAPEPAPAEPALPELLSMDH